MPLRLGFPVKVLGAPNMKTSDARRWQSGPHLRVSLEYLDAVLDYLAENDIRMYRMSSDIAPYATHPDLAAFHNQVAECRDDLAAFGQRARRLDIRLSFHPSQFVVINSPDAQLRAKSIWDLTSQADMLDCMGLDDEAVMVIHVGGAYDDPQASIDRWCRTWEAELPEPVRRRLVLEHDDLRFSAADVLRIHRRTGVRLVFDYQHFCCLNPERLALRATLEQFLKSWPSGIRPKIHYSSPRTEMREVTRKNRKTGKKQTVLQPPVWTGHAAFNNPFEFIGFMRALPDFDFDIMLEAKAKDLALLRLRQDILRFAPDLAARFGLDAARVHDMPEEVALAATDLEF